MTENNSQRTSKRRKTFKRLTATLLALLMVVTVMAVGFPVTANAEQTAVTYAVYSWDDETKTLSHTNKTVTDYTAVTEAYLKANKYTLEGGPSAEESKVFVVTKSITLLKRLKIKKKTFVDLVIPKGVQLTPRQGISCSYGKTSSGFAAVRILGAGRIEASSSYECAAIGGDSGEVNGLLEFHGPEVQSIAYTGGAGIGGGKSKRDADETTYIKFFAGKIIAYGHDCEAGISGGDNQIGAKNYVYGGDVYGGGANGGAAFGGGKDEGTRGIWIYGGSVRAVGGVDAAGIGTGEDANMNGTIYIGGEKTRLNAWGGQRGAGIGAGDGDTSFFTSEGDMNGTITIDCGDKSDIVAYGGNTFGDYIDNVGAEGGAGIGTGYAGNMTGKVYIKGGNITVFSGCNAAGIGGGQEMPALYQGGEGGKVYISGGKMKIWAKDKGHEAIGAGSNDKKSGSVYISHDNNGAESYMRVRYQDNDNWVAVNANKRTSKLHSESNVLVETCDHTDGNGVSGLTYTINTDGTKHIKKCKYCGYEVIEDHSSCGSCVCGSSADIKYTVTLNENNMNDISDYTVAAGSDFVLPEGKDYEYHGSDGYINKFTKWKNGVYTYEPGETVTVTSNMTFNALYEKTYSVNIIPTSDGTATTDKQTAANDETVYIFPEPADGYEVDTITVQGLRYEYGSFVHYEDVINPDEKGDYKFVMQESSTDVTVTFKKSPNHVYISDGIENGTVSSDMETADESETVTLTAEPDEGYALKTLRCKKQDGTEIELTKVDDTHYTFEMPDESVFVSAEFDFSDSADGMLVGHSLSLKGNIGVNFYMDLDETIANSQSAYMYFTIPGDTVTYQTVYVNEQPDASLPHAEQKIVGGKTYYVFPCSVAAKEMTSAFTAQIIDGDHQGKKYTYSVKHYADYLVANADTEGTDEQKAYAEALPLVQEMLQYGNYAMAYFDDQELSDILGGEIPETFASFTSDLPDDKTYAGATLSLKSETTLSLYFTKNHTLSDISCVDKDGKARTIETKTTGSYQIIRIRNISAKELQDNFTVSFKIDGTSYSITYSPMNYCYKVQNGSSDDTKLQKVVKALYRYSEMANVYFSEES